MSLHRLVYHSRNHASKDGELDGQIRDGITGTLLFNAGCFAQVLEGPLDRIEAAFERFQRDERHGDVSRLALDAIEARSLPNWAMGFVGASDRDAGRFAAIGSASGFDPARLDGDRIHTLLRDLTIEEKAA